MTKITVNYSDELQERLIAFFEAGSKDPKFLANIRFQIENGALAVLPTIEGTAYFEGDHNRSSIDLHQLTQDDNSTPLSGEELVRRVQIQVEIRDNHIARVNEREALRLEVGKTWVEQQEFQAINHSNGTPEGYTEFKGPNGENISGSVFSLVMLPEYAMKTNAEGSASNGKEPTPAPAS